MWAVATKYYSQSDCVPRLAFYACVGGCNEVLFTKYKLFLYKVIWCPGTKAISEATKSSLTKRLFALVGVP